MPAFAHLSMDSGVAITLYACITIRRTGRDLEHGEKKLPACGKVWVRSMRGLLHQDACLRLTR
jgi:hypothetical protein